MIALLLRMVAEFVSLVVVQPVREGRIRNLGWPHGLTPVVAVAGMGYAVAGGLVLVAGPLRGRGALTTSPGQEVVPEVALAPLLLLVVLALALAVTSVLHVHRLAAAAVLVLVGSLLVQVGALTATTLGPVAVFLVLLSGSGLLLLLLVRYRRGFGWGEFPVVAVCLATGLLGPLILLQGPQREIGFDLRVVTMTQIFVAASQLAIPAMIIAGTALVEIAVTAAGWGLRLIRDEAPRTVWRVVAAVLVVGGLAGVAWRLRTDQLPVLFSAIPLLAGLALLLLLRARRRPVQGQLTPERLSELWPLLLPPLAVGCAFFLLPAFVVVTLQAVVQATQSPIAAGVVGVVSVLTSTVVNSLVRLVLVVGCVVLAVRWTRRGEHARPLLLLCFAVLAVPGIISTFTGARIRLPWSTDGLAVVSILLAVLLLAVFALGRRLTARRLTAMMMVLALSGCFLFRGVIADPIALALGVSAIALVLFGLVWRLLTDADWTRTGSDAFPVAARVLFFWANSLLAVTVLAYVALTRSLGGTVDQTPFAGLGDFLLGTPLYLAAVLGCVWQSLHPDLAPVLPVPDDGGHLRELRYGAASQPTPAPASAVSVSGSPSGWTAAVSPSSTVVRNPAARASSAVARTQTSVAMPQTSTASTPRVASQSLSVSPSALRPSKPE